MSSVIKEMNDILMHYGMPRRSGRYPYGSGKDPYQHTRDLLSRVEELKKQGWTETPDNIMAEFGLTTTQYRAQKGLAKDLRRMDDVARVKSWSEDGMSPTEMSKKMKETYGRDVNESTIRSWLNSESEYKMMQAKNTADFIRSRIDEVGIVDVGAGVERELNISKEKLNQALEILKSEGYVVQSGGIPQVTNSGQQTITKVIGPPDMEKREFYDFKNGEANIHSLKEYISRDNGETYEKKFNYPESLDSSRLKILLRDEVGPDGTTGIQKDGVIELRRGVADLDLGESNYSQVRILVDGTHYLKGMAVYSDNLPDGVDVLFNSNKTSADKALKKIKDDPENPFGSAIKDSEQGGQYWYTDADGNKKLGLINKARDEGDWTEWKDKLPAQFLSKQPVQLAKKQLGLAVDAKQDEFNELLSLTNPTVKKHLLDKFADECDSAAVHLQAAALPGQKYHVILPINSLKDNEVYAPGYEEGTQLALIRYPHGGTFEIPILTVTHKNKEASKVIGKDSIDAVGITANVAGRLSGADFDGDTVMCIPTSDKVKIKNKNPLQGLEGFEAKDEYGAHDSKVINGVEHYYRNGIEFKPMKNTQTEMGKISNLITDMTLLGADDDKLARAVRHSMVVIDAEKHHLDYKQSEIDNDIAALKREYQKKVTEDGRVTYGGASTLISKSKGETTVLKRQGSPVVNLKGSADYDPTRPEGSLIYKTADDVAYTVTRTNKRTGEVTTTTKYRHQASTRMAEADDAYDLVSEANTPMEREYANYANSMKSLARQARIESASTGKIVYSKAAKTTYQAEVDSLMDKLNTAELNRPRERQAQYLANVEVANRVNSVKATLRKNNPTATESEINKMAKKEIDVKKASQQAQTKARVDVGSVSRKARSIEITDREWEAIQAGAISENYLKKILNNSDVDVLRQRATPRTTSGLSQAQVNKIKAMSASDYTLAEIAKAAHVSTSVVSKYLKEN